MKNKVALLFALFTGLVAGQPFGVHISAAATNSTFVMKPTISPSIDVTALGARPEVGFDNTEIFQYCLNNFDDIYIPAGNYEYREIVFRRKNVRLHGVGMGKTILISTRSTASRLHLPPNIRILNSGCTIEGLTSTYKYLPEYRQNAEGRNAINEDANISVGWSEADASAKSFKVENVTVQHCEVIGSVVQGIAIGVSEGVKIIGNTVTGTRGTGIYGYYSDKIAVIGNRVSFTGDDGIYIGANGRAAYSPHPRNSNVVISHNFVQNSSAKGIGISGCSNAEISYNTINSTFVDGILLSADKLGGHVPPRNVKVHNNNLLNIFGEFGANRKHLKSANAELGGFFGMIAVITDDPRNENNMYEIYSNQATADTRLRGIDGHYGSYVFGHNVKVYDNKFSIGYFGIMIGNPNSENERSTSAVTLTGNEFENFYRNAVLIKASEVIIERNIFGNAEWCITEEWVRNVRITANYFPYAEKFFFNQTGSTVEKMNNVFK